MADIPSPMTWGTVRGNFGALNADSSDAGLAPDLDVVQGTVTLTPRIPLVKILSLTTPMIAIAKTVNCSIINGVLIGPDGSPDVRVVASDSPGFEPAPLQWDVRIQITGATVQPAPMIIDVPGGKVVDLALVVPSPPAIPVVTVVTEESKIAAMLAASEAQASAQAAYGFSADAKNALTDSLAARVAAIDARNAAQAASSTAVTAKDTAVSSANSSNTSKNSAEVSASAAAAKASEAAGSATDAARARDAAIEAATGVVNPDILFGSYSQRPVASDYLDKTIYNATDVHEQYVVRNGTWNIYGSGGNEIASAVSLTNFVTTSPTNVDVPGLSVTFVVGERPVEVELSTMVGQTLGNYIASGAIVLDGSNQIAGFGGALPGAGTGTFFMSTGRTVRISNLVPGTTHTVKIVFGASGGGQSTLYGTQTNPALLVVRNR